MRMLSVVGAVALAAASATAGTGEMKSAPRWTFAEAPADVGEKPYATPADVIPDHAGFTVSATFVFGPHADNTGVELFSQRTAETGWSLSGQQSARSGRRAVLNVNGVPYSLGSFNERDGKPHEWTVTARRGTVVVYRDGAVLSRVYATIVPNLEPIKVGGPVPGLKNLKPIVGTKLVKMRVWGKDEEYFAKGEPTGFAAGKIGGKGWMISLPKNANDKDLPGLLYFGDSISHGWETAGAASLAELRKNYSVFVGGFSGDRTYNALWRVRHGELDGFEAGVVTLLIGTNNWAENTVDETVADIAGLVSLIREKQPKAKLLLMPILPRGGRRSEFKNIKNDEINASIEALADGHQVVWLDLRQASAGAPKSLMPDGLHPGVEGYEIWRKALLPHLSRTE